MFTLRKCNSIQKQLIYATLDDFTPNDALSDIFGGQYGCNPRAWENSVIDFIYNAMKLNLIKPMQCMHGFEKLSPDQVKQLLIKSKTNPDLEKSEDLTWDILYLHGTEKLKQAAEKFKIDNWDALTHPADSDFFQYINKVE